MQDQQLTGIVYLIKQLDNMRASETTIRTAVDKYFEIDGQHSRVLDHFEFPKKKERRTNHVSDVDDDVNPIEPIIDPYPENETLFDLEAEGDELYDALAARQKLRLNAHVQTAKQNDEAPQAETFDFIPMEMPVEKLNPPPVKSLFKLFSDADNSQN